MEFVTKADYAYQRLRDDIVSGKLASGTKLVINDLAKEYNLSAMPVRNAITRLEEVGLVKNTAHVGARVSGVDLNSYFSLMLLRIEAEALATSFATLNRTEATVDELDDLMQLMLHSKISGNLEVYGKANRAFHHTVYNACDNKIILDYVNNLFERTRMSVYTFSVLPSSIDQSCDEHMQWLLAIKKKDVDRSVAIIRHQRCRSNLAMLDHIKASLQRGDKNDLFLQACGEEINERQLAQYQMLFQNITHRSTD